MSTTIMHSEGDADRRGTLRMQSEVTNPMGKRESFRDEIRWKNKNTFVYKMYNATPGSPEFQMMEIVYSKSR